MSILRTVLWILGLLQHVSGILSTIGLFIFLVMNHDDFYSIRSYGNPIFFTIGITGFLMLMYICGILGSWSPIAGDVGLAIAFWISYQLNETALRHHQLGYFLWASILMVIFLFGHSLVSFGRSNELKRTAPSSKEMQQARLWSALAAVPLVVAVGTGFALDGWGNRGHIGFYTSVSFVGPAVVALLALPSQIMLTGTGGVLSFLLGSLSTSTAAYHWYHYTHYGSRNWLWNLFGLAYTFSLLCALFCFTTAEYYMADKKIAEGKQKTCKAVKTASSILYVLGIGSLLAFGFFLWVFHLDAAVYGWSIPILAMQAGTLVLALGFWVAGVSAQLPMAGGVAYNIIAAAMGLTGRYLGWYFSVAVAIIGLIGMCIDTGCMQMLRTSLEVQPTRAKKNKRTIFGICSAVLLFFPSVILCVAFAVHAYYRVPHAGWLWYGGFIHNVLIGLPRVGLQTTCGGLDVVVNILSIAIPMLDPVMYSGWKAWNIIIPGTCVFSLIGYCVLSLMVKPDKNDSELYEPLNTNTGDDDVVPVNENSPIYPKASAYTPYATPLPTHQQHVENYELC